MKNCVATQTYACDGNKVWLYLTRPTLNHWRAEVKDVETSDDGMKMTEHNADGSTTEIVYSVKEKPRRFTCDFTRGRIHGTFTAILLGGADNTSLECTLDVDGLGFFTKPSKLLKAYLEELRKGLAL